jgi:3'(2'), 5'-bisphosphate nucleotidase
VKFCWLAEGTADVYPRLAPPNEWDIAAGHAILAAAGGAMIRTDGEAFRYGAAERKFRAPAFIAWGDPEAVARYRV